MIPNPDLLFLNFTNFLWKDLLYSRQWRIQQEVSPNLFCKTMLAPSANCLKIKHFWSSFPQGKTALRKDTVTPVALRKDTVTPVALRKDTVTPVALRKDTVTPVRAGCLSSLKRLICVWCTWSVPRSLAHHYQFSFLSVVKDNTPNPKWNMYC